MLNFLILCVKHQFEFQLLSFQSSFFNVKVFKRSLARSCKSSKHFRFFVCRIRIFIVKWCSKFDYWSISGRYLISNICFSNVSMIIFSPLYNASKFSKTYFLFDLYDCFFTFFFFNLSISFLKSFVFNFAISMLMFPFINFN